MKIESWLESVTTQLADTGIETPRLDALVLLEDITGKDRTHLLAYPESRLSKEQLKKLDLLISRRLRHEPLAYIRNKVEFYGHEFEVNNHTLVPRPESEHFIDLLNEYGEIPTIIDVGTGSGALAISAKLAKPGAEVFGLDIDPNCIEIALANALKHRTEVTFKNSDLLRVMDLNDQPSPVAILANLPYVPDAYKINPAARHEPELALFGGKDGLDLYRIMFSQLDEYEDLEIIVLTEALESQHTNLAGIAFDHGFVPAKTRGLIQAFTRVP